jgi:hypothetical protein
MEYAMMHLTYSGLMAGLPLCDKKENLPKDDQFCHYSTLYGFSDTELIKSDQFCPNCRAVLAESLED